MTPLTWVLAPEEAASGPDAARTAADRLGSVDLLRSPVHAIAALLAADAPGAHARWELDPLPPDRLVGLPPRLWQRVLDAARVAPLPPSLVHVRDGDAEPFPPIGVTRGAVSEWWGRADTPGAAHARALWAWGAVSGIPGDLGEASPRATWRWHPGGWRALLPPSTLPDEVSLALARGPSLLAEALHEATRALAAAASFSDRDLAMVWASAWLPLLAPARSLPPGTAPPPPTALRPDYTSLLAFHALHPRAQAAVRALDALGTALAAGDTDALHALADAAGVDADGLTEEEIARGVVAAVQRSVHHRRAAETWDGGFGYLLVRALIDAVADAPDLCRALDAALHGSDDDAPPGDPNLPRGGDVTGALALRLRRALTVALSFAGRDGERRELGPAAEQLADLAWLAWTDPDFLAG